MFLNARSLLNNFKLEELTVFVVKNDIKIIGIAESWLNESVDNNEVAIENFTLYRRDRSEIKAGRGGVYCCMCIIL